LEEHCVNVQGVEYYDILFGVTGFPPNTQFTLGMLRWLNAGAGPFTFTTDGNGDLIVEVGELDPGVTWTWTVDSPYLGGTVTKMLTVSVNRSRRASSNATTAATSLSTSNTRASASPSYNAGQSPRGCASAYEVKHVSRWWQ
jgi:hypothetical protein